LTSGLGSYIPIQLVGAANLVQSGHLQKTNFKVRIPRHLYEDCQDRQFVIFMDEFGIVGGDWQTDFLCEDSRRHVKAWSVKYCVSREGSCMPSAVGGISSGLAEDMRNLKRHPKSIDANPMGRQKRQD